MPASANFLAVHPFAPPDIVDPPEAPTYRYRPDITTLTGPGSLAALETLSLATGSRIDLVIGGLLSSYILQFGAPTGSPSEVVPLDYDLLLNNVYWRLATVTSSSSGGEQLPLTFADINGVLDISQLPPGSIGTLESIDEDALYFFNNSTGQPMLINAAEAASFVGLFNLTFADIGGQLSETQLPDGTVVTIDSIDADALYFYDNTTGLPRLVDSTEAANFVGLNTLQFSDIGGILDISQFPSDIITTVDSIDEDALYFFDNTTFAPRLLSKTDARTFLGVSHLDGYTVATLPATPLQGDTAFVTDATAPTYHTAVTGGGSVVAPVFYNGTNWIT